LLLDNYLLAAQLVERLEVRYMEAEPTEVDTQASSTVALVDVDSHSSFGLWCGEEPP